MIINREDDRAAWAKGYSWAAQLMTVSLEMALPPVGGYWLDGWIHTTPWMVIIGTVFGFSAGMWQLLRIAQAQNKANQPDQPTKDRETGAKQ